MKIIENVIRMISRASNRWLARKDWWSRSLATEEVKGEVIAANLRNEILRVDGAPPLTEEERAAGVQWVFVKEYGGLVRRMKDTRVVFPLGLQPETQYGPGNRTWTCAHWDRKNNALITAKLEELKQTHPESDVAKLVKESQAVAVPMLTGAWVGPCTLGKGSKIVFSSKYRDQVFQATRLLVNVARLQSNGDDEKGQPKGLPHRHRRLCLGSMYIGNETVSAGGREGNDQMDLEALGHPEAFDTCVRLKPVAKGVDMGIEVHLEGEDLQEGEIIALSAQFVGYFGDPQANTLQAK